MTAASTKNGNGIIAKVLMLCASVIGICTLITLYLIDDAQAEEKALRAEQDKRIEIQLDGIKESLCEIKASMKELNVKMEEATR